MVNSCLLELVSSHFSSSALRLYVRLVTIPGVNSIWQLTSRLTALQVTTGDPQVALLPLLTSVLWAALMATWQDGDRWMQTNSQQQPVENYLHYLFLHYLPRIRAFFFFFWLVLLVTLADAGFILILCWRGGGETQRDQKGFALVCGKALKGWRKAEDHPLQWCQSVYKLWAQEAETFKLEASFPHKERTHRKQVLGQQMAKKTTCEIQWVDRRVDGTTKHDLPISVPGYWKMRE